MDKSAFDPIIGYDNIKLELLQILDQLLHPEKYAALNVAEPHGLMLYGDPGVGKSTFAMCFLAASGRKTYICRKEKPNGEFVKEIVNTFDEAAKNAPSVILLDDLDKFANEDDTHRNAEEFVTVQTCIDKVKDQRVFVVATANNLKNLPTSLTRAGRFDHLLTINCPEGKDAEAIVAHYLSKKEFVKSPDVKRITRLLAGRSCAELEAVVNRAGAYAAFDGRQQVEMQDMIRAILRVIFQAPEKPDADERSLPLIACHEAGHALIAELLEPGSVNLVSILSHDSSSAGITSIHRDETYFFSKKLMENRVMCLLAGKAATEICYGAVDTGVLTDMQRAFDIVHRFVDYYCAHGFDSFVYTKDVSNEVMDRRDSAVATEMARFYERVVCLLEQHRPQLDALTRHLLKEKTLLGDRVQELLRCA